MATILEKANQILNEKNTKILPNTLKQGTSFFDVNGELIELIGQEKTVTPSEVEQVITPDEGFTGITKVTVAGVTPVEVSSGVKLFETEEAMNADNTTKADELALVYGDEYIPFQKDTVAQVLHFPSEVTLPEAVTGDLRVMLEGGGIYGECYITPTEFGLYLDEYSISYTSEDGQHYTRTDDLEETIDTGASLRVSMPEYYWTDYFGYFCQVVGMGLKGLYKSEPIEVGWKLKYIKDMRWENGAIAYSISEDYEDFTKLIEIIREKAPYKQVNIFIVGNMAYLQWTPSYYGIYENDGTFRISVGLNTTDVTKYVSTINMDTWEIVENAALTADPECYALFQNSQGLVNYYYSNLKFNSIDKFIRINVKTDTVVNMTPVGLYSFQKGVLPTSVSVETSMEKEYAYKYFLAPTQFDATAEHIYNNKTTYSKQGVLKGTLGSSVAKDLSDTANELYTKFMMAYQDFTPVKASEIGQNNYYLTNVCSIPVNYKGEPFIDCSEQANCYGLFRTMNNLIAVPKLDLRNATDISWMFHQDTQLKYMPAFEIPKVTSMSSFVATCDSLTDESLNNIMATMLTAAAYTGTKTLKYIGLSAEQTTRCQSLSNWAALSAAGWTTGY